MKTMMITDIASLFGKPSREMQLALAVDKLEDFCSSRRPPIELDSSTELLNLMEQLTSDHSMVLDNPIAWWSVEHRINNTWDLSCQCSRVKNFCKYNVVMWEYDPKGDETKGQPDVKDFFPIEGWTEMLPEKH